VSDRSTSSVVPVLCAHLVSSNCYLVKDLIYLFISFPPDPFLKEGSSEVLSNSSPPTLNGFLFFLYAAGQFLHPLPNTESVSPPTTLLPLQQVKVFATQFHSCTFSFEQMKPILYFPRVLDDDFLPFASNFFLRPRFAYSFPPRDPLPGNFPNSPSWHPHLPQGNPLSGFCSRGSHRRFQPLFSPFKKSPLM